MLRVPQKEEAGVDVAEPLCSRAELESDPVPLARENIVGFADLRRGAIAFTALSVQLIAAKAMRPKHQVYLRRLHKVRREDPLLHRELDVVDNRVRVDVEDVRAHGRPQPRELHRVSELVEVDVGVAQMAIYPMFDGPFGWFCFAI